MDRIKNMDEQERIELSKYYKGLVESLGLNENYVKSKEITDRLHITDRVWRKHCENMLFLYNYRYLDKLLVGNQKGYIYTSDSRIIEAFLDAKENEFKSKAYNFYTTTKAIRQRDNLRFEDVLSEVNLNG